MYTDPGEGSDGAIRKARAMVAGEPDKLYYVDQYSNDANWHAHFKNRTADEIWQQTDSRVTHFAAMLGTSGTFVGTSRRLKELNPTIHCTSLQPDSPFHGIEGAKHIKTSIVPEIYDASIADADSGIKIEEAYLMARHMACDAAPGSVMVTIFSDSGDKYLSEHFWDEHESRGKREQQWP